MDDGVPVLRGGRAPDPAAARATDLAPPAHAQSEEQIPDGSRPAARPRRARHRWAWVMMLVLGAVAIVAYVLIPDWRVRDALYLALGLATVAAIVVGIRINHPVRRAPWYLMAAGQTLWVVGDSLWSWYRDVAEVETFPSVGDAFYLLAYPLFGAAVLLMMRRRGLWRDLGGQLDSALVTVGFGLLVWVLIVRPTLEDFAVAPLATAVGVAYPVADVLLMALAARLITLSGGRSSALRMLFAALVLLVVADTIALTLDLLTEGSNPFADALWLGSYVLWAATALHPSMRPLSDNSQAAEPRFSEGRMVALTLAVLVAPGTLAVEHLLGRPLHIWAVVVASVVMFLLVVARMNLALNQILTANRLRDEAQQELARQAAHDSLTGVPNRAQALRLIQGALSRAQRTGAIVGLLFVDLDGFKRVNDTYGHAAGDQVLQAVAQRMQWNVRPGDVVARLGGDEFVVLLEPLDEQSSALTVAERLILAVSAPVALARGGTVRVGASVGVALSQDAGTDASALMHEADIAVYRAKAAGRGRIEVFDASLRRELQLKTELEIGLATAIQADELVLHYQPIVDLRTGRVRGYEALVRWERPGVGLVPPSDFVPIAEQSELICDLDVWVLERACRQLAQWNREGGDLDVTVAVNISGRHLSRSRVVDDVTRALENSSITPRQLILEITETTLLDDPIAHVNVEHLRELGVTMSMDDFGTGYNSIARLETLPVDMVKIDRRYLQSSTPSSETLLRLIVQAAHAYGLPVVAEGVERPEQLDLLQQISAEAAQGYLLGRPAEADTILPRQAAGAGRQPG